MLTDHHGMTIAVYDGHLSMTPQQLPKWQLQVQLNPEYSKDTTTTFRLFQRQSLIKGTQDVKIKVLNRRVVLILDGHYSRIFSVSVKMVRFWKESPSSRAMGISNNDWCLVCILNFFLTKYASVSFQGRDHSAVLLKVVIGHSQHQIYVKFISEPILGSDHIVVRRRGVEEPLLQQRTTRIISGYIQVSFSGQGPVVQN